MRRISAGCRKSAMVMACALVYVVSSFSALAQDSPKLKVVASTADLAALAAAVGGERAEVHYLASGNQDLHFVQPKSSYLLKLRKADLLIVVGLELDSGWLTRGHHNLSLISQSGNARIQPGAPGYFDASQYAEILEMPTRLVTPSIQPFGNPHYWLDPENGRKIAEALTKKLGELRPKDIPYFDHRFQVFSKRLSDAEEVWNAEARPYYGRKVVTYYRSWSNFLNYFHLVSVGEIEPRPGIPPNPHHTSELVDLMKSQHAAVILMEPYFERKTPGTIARITGAKVVVMPSSVGGDNSVTDYFQLFDYDLALLTAAFKATR